MRISSAIVRLRSSPAWRPWIEAAKVVVFVRVVFLLIAHAGGWLLADTRGAVSVGLDDWVRFDAAHLLKVARYGYTDPATFPHATVFFPLFPLLVKVVSFLGTRPVVAGMLISAIASVVAFAYLYRLAEEDYGASSGKRAVLYLAFFPTGLFLVAPYTEALFLAGAIPAFYYARRSRWPLTALAGAVAMAARNTGIFLAAGLLAESLRQRDVSAKKTPALLAVAFTALPLLLYCAYLWRIKGDPFYFLTDYRRGWGREFVSPVTSLSTTVSMTEISSYPTNWMMAARGELIAAAIAVGLLAWTVVKREWGYTAFIGSLLVVLSTGPFFYSVPRALLQFFPSVLFLVDFVNQRPQAHAFVLTALSSVAVLGVVVYTHGGWFY